MDLSRTSVTIRGRLRPVAVLCGAALALLGGGCVSPATAQDAPHAAGARVVHLAPSLKVGSARWDWRPVVAAAAGLQFELGAGPLTGALGLEGWALEQECTLTCGPPSTHALALVGAVRWRPASGRLLWPLLGASVGGYRWDGTGLAGGVGAEAAIEIGAANGFALRVGAEARLLTTGARVLQASAGPRFRL
jgi:hypothetical protein